MKKSLLVALCSAGILIAGCSNTPIPDGKMAEGKWHGVVANAAPGQPVPQLVVTGDIVEFHDANPAIWVKGKLTLRETTTPKQLDLLVSEAFIPMLVGQTIHGIYKVDGEKLVLAAGEPGAALPTGFDAPGEHQFVFSKK